MVRCEGRYIEFEDVNWTGIFTQILDHKSFLRIHFYTTQSNRKRYEAAAKACGVDVPMLFFSPYSGWKDDVDATLAAFLMASTIRSLQKLPKDGQLHVIVFSGDADYINAYKFMKDIARGLNKKLKISVAAWKPNLPKPKNRAALEHYVDEIIELLPP